MLAVHGEALLHNQLTRRMNNCLPFLRLLMSHVVFMVHIYIYLNIYVHVSSYLSYTRGGAGGGHNIYFVVCHETRLSRVGRAVNDAITSSTRSVWI